MIDSIARSWTITRRSLGAAAFGIVAAIAYGAWPIWTSRGNDEAQLDALKALPAADALQALGRRYGATASLGKDALEQALRTRLGQGYEAAVRRDRETGALVSVDGWLVPETQALAGLWLSSAP